MLTTTPSPRDKPFFEVSFSKTFPVYKKQALKAMCFFIAGAVDSNLGKEVPRNLLRFKANSATETSCI